MPFQKRVTIVTSEKSDPLTDGTSTNSGALNVRGRAGAVYAKKATASNMDSQGSDLLLDEKSYDSESDLDIELTYLEELDLKQD